MTHTMHCRMSDREEFPVGTVVESGTGNRWRKRDDGRWQCLTDPDFGPHESFSLPAYLSVTFPVVSSE